MNNTKMPYLSVILITPDRFQSIEMILDYLIKQTIREKLEIVIVCPSINDLEPDLSMLSTFYSYRFIELGKFKSTGRCMAEGYLNSSSDIVAYCEEHSYPDHKWAEIIVKKHWEQWAAVGWSVANYNPESLIGWTCLYIDFGKSVEPGKSQRKKYLAGHHISYKKSVLLKYRENLGELLENEAVFLRLLSRDNYDLYFESSAISYHTNVSGFYSFLKSEFLGGRQFTGLIVTYEDWDIPKRIAFAAITPLRPILKICRVIRDLYKTRRLLKLIFPIFPILVTGVVVNAVGELLGYTMGIGDTSLKRLDIELKRNRN